jgi:hypothetical protein
LFDSIPTQLKALKHILVSEANSGKTLSTLANRNRVYPERERKRCGGWIVVAEKKDLDVSRAVQDGPRILNLTRNKTKLDVAALPKLATAYESGAKELSTCTCLSQH